MFRYELIKAEPADRERVADIKYFIVVRGLAARIHEAANTDG
jgi:hypothetical protein